ncbi:MAG: hypothetical protein LBD55_01445 [Treponema sp.]|jgi:hypothetical protein|nr:hypothetical protein [Treponema sp.]
MVEWKNQGHCTEEASCERLNRMFCEAGTPHEGTGSGTGIIGKGAAPPEGIRLVPE